MLRDKSGSYVAWTDQTYFNPFVEAANPGQPWKPVSFITARGASQDDGWYGIYAQQDGADQNMKYSNYYVNESDLTNGKFNADSIQYVNLCGFNPNTIRSTELNSGNDWKPYSLIKRPILSFICSNFSRPCHTPQ